MDLEKLSTAYHVDGLGRLQQRIVSPVLRGRSPSPERTSSRGWGIRRSRGLTSRYHSAPVSAGNSMNRGKSRPLMSTRRGQFSTSGSTAPGSSRAESPQKPFTDYLSDVIIPLTNLDEPGLLMNDGTFITQWSSLHANNQPFRIPIQMPVDEFNLHKSSGAQSFCSTSKMKYVALPHVSESRASSGTSPRPNSRPVPMCSERYMVTPITQITFPKANSSRRSRPKSDQQQRFEEGAKALARCRVLKRTSEILSHRMDRLYYMSGVSLNLGNRYATDEEALRQIQALAEEARMLQLKNNTPCDSLPKLNQISPEPSHSHMGGDGEQGNGAAVDGRGQNRDSSLTNDSAVDKENFFITQNGAVDSNVPEANHSQLPHQPGNTQSNVERAVVEETNGELNHVSNEDIDDEVFEGNQAQGEKIRPSTAVRDRRMFLFGSTERHQRRESVLTKRSSQRVMSLYDKYRDEASREEEEIEDLEDAEDFPEDDEDEVLTSEEISNRMKALIQAGNRKSLHHDRSIFRDKANEPISKQDEDSGVKYTPLVHREEKKQEEFRNVTKHLVVKQEESILHVEANMDEEQAAMFSKMFANIDTDNDGKIGIEDLQSHLFSHLKAVDLPHFLRVFDINKDQIIDRREFLAVAGLNDKLCKQRTTSLDGNWHVDLEKLSYYITVYKEMFDIVDIDHDGRLSLEELMVIIAASLDEETGTDIELMEDILESIDRDGSGSIDFVEYLQYIPMFLQIHNYLMRKPMLIEDIEKSRRIVRLTLQQRNDSESSADNIWDD